MWLTEQFEGVPQSLEALIEFNNSHADIEFDSRQCSPLLGFISANQCLATNRQ